MRNAMRNAMQPSWRLATDAPRDLNFALYVACAFNMIPDTPPFTNEQVWSAYRAGISDKEEYGILLLQWVRWWQDIVQDRAKNELSGRWSRHYAPDGSFIGLAEPLRKRCEEVFHSFSDWWGLAAGGQQGVNFWDQEVEFHPIVKRVESELGRTVQPFRLMVDYVYTGLGSIVNVTPTYAIMSVHRPDLSVGNNDWWLAKVRELA